VPLRLSNRPQFLVRMSEGEGDEKGAVTASGGPRAASSSAHTVKGIAEDMPKLNDARRFIRVCLGVDTFLHVLRAVREGGESGGETVCLTDVDFMLCGGRIDKGCHARHFSLYRQLVYAKRDLEAFYARGYFPTKKSIIAAKTARPIGFTFYDTESEMVAAPIRADAKFRLPRIIYVLQTIRRMCRPFRGTMCASSCARSLVRHTISYSDFVQCGGYRTVSKTERFSFWEVLLTAKRDCESIIKDGRCVRKKNPASQDETSDDEDVEHLDDVREADGDAMDSANDDKEERSVRWEEPLDAEGEEAEGEEAEESEWDGEECEEEDEEEELLVID
jgi:hypothetical protein